MGKGRRLRNFCFTWNNYPADYEQVLRSIPAKYIVFGEEKGESGTPHIQGYCELKAQTSFEVIKKKLPKAHIEPRKGSPQQAADYCKKDGKFKEVGEISQPGKRTDIARLRSDIQKGKNRLYLYNNHDAMWRYRSAAREYKFLLDSSNKAFAPVEVIVIWGTAGVGKSKRAREIDPELFQVTEDGKWWDGYEGQETILFDDFYGGIKYSRMLKLIDGYPFQLQVKGGFTWKKWKRVIITSNNPPETWYQYGMTPALKRRIARIEQIDA